MSESYDERSGSEQNYRRQIACHQIVTTIASTFANIRSDEVDRGIQEALKSLSESIGASRGQVFLFNDDRTRFDSAYEWCSGDTESYKDRLQNIEVERFPYFMENFRRLQGFAFRRLKDIPEQGGRERQHLESLGICSSVVVPLSLHHNLVGFMAFDSHADDISMPGECIALLALVGEVFAGAMDRRRVEETQKDGEGLHRLLAENISDVIWTMDAELREVQYLSPSVRNLTGFTPGEVMRMSLTELLDPESLRKAVALFESNVESMRSGTFEPLTVEFDIVCRDGTTVPTESRVSVVYAADGSPLHILGVTRDVSERKKIEDQLRQSVKMQAIGELAGGVAHEFNNMLTGILGYANMLRLTAEPGTTVHESARTIEKAAERAADLTRKLLGFARRGRQCREPVDLHGVIGDVVSLLRQTISENIHVSCEMNAEDLVIAGDSGQIEQVLLNLALNARDAMPSGGDLVFTTGTADFNDTSSLPEPEVRPGRFAVVTVADTGSGITREDMKRIFEPFFTTKGHGRGTGMGLAMVYGTVRNHGGFTRVESRPGEGTTFKVYLPLDRHETPDEPVAEAEAAPQSWSGKILVVDDEDLVRDVARGLLEVSGYEVVTVSSGQEAVDYYRDHGDGVDLVLIDMVMPEMSGRECFRALREMDPNVRAVLSTGYGADGEAREVVQEGMAGLVLKPFSRAALGATIREALSEDVVTVR